MHTLVRYSRRVSPTMSMCGLLSTDGCPVSFSRGAFPLKESSFQPGGGGSRGSVLPRLGLERSLVACWGTTSPTKRARGSDMAAPRPASKYAEESDLLPLSEDQDYTAAATTTTKQSQHRKTPAPQERERFLLFCCSLAGMGGGPPHA